MGQDCLWDSEEHEKGLSWSAPRCCMGQDSGRARRKTEVLLKVDALNSWSVHCFSMGPNCLWDSVEHHRGFAPCCPRGSLVPYKSEEQISCSVHFLSCSSLSQIQSCPIQKRGTSVLRGSPYGESLIFYFILFFLLLLCWWWWWWCCLCLCVCNLHPFKQKKVATCSHKQNFWFCWLHWSKT